MPAVAVPVEVQYPREVFLPLLDRPGEEAVLACRAVREQWRVNEQLHGRCGFLVDMRVPGAAEATLVSAVTARMLMLAGDAERHYGFEGDRAYVTQEVARAFLAAVSTYVVGAEVPIELVRRDAEGNTEFDISFYDATFLRQ